MGGHRAERTGRSEDGYSSAIGIGRRCSPEDVVVAASDSDEPCTKKLARCFDSCYIQRACTLTENLTWGASRSLSMTWTSSSLCHGPVRAGRGRPWLVKARRRNPRSREICHFTRADQLERVLRCQTPEDWSSGSSLAPPEST